MASDTPAAFSAHPVRIRCQRLHRGDAISAMRNAKSNRNAPVATPDFGQMFERRTVRASGDQRINPGQFRQCLEQDVIGFAGMKAAQRYRYGRVERNAEIGFMNGHDIRFRFGEIVDDADFVLRHAAVDQVAFQVRRDDVKIVGGLEILDLVIPAEPRTAKYRCGILYPASWCFGEPRPSMSDNQGRERPIILPSFRSKISTVAEELCTFIPAASSAGTRTDWRGSYPMSAASSSRCTYRRRFRRRGRARHNLQDFHGPDYSADFLSAGAASVLAASFPPYAAFSSRLPRAAGFSSASMPRLRITSSGRSVWRSSVIIHLRCGPCW